MASQAHCAPGAVGKETLAVIMPAFNEEGSIADAIEEVCQYVMAPVPDAILWVIDDGSRDRTGVILDDLATSEPRLHVIHQPNAGHGAALRTGMNRASSEWLLLLDSDQQIPLDDFRSAWTQRQSRDAVFGRRLRRNDPLIRKIISAGLRIVVRGLFGMNLADPNAPFKLIRRSVWQEAQGAIPANCLITSVFLAVYTHHAQRQWTSFDIAYRDRHSGRPSQQGIRLAKFSLCALVQLVAFRGGLRSYPHQSTQRNQAAASPEKP